MSIRALKKELQARKIPLKGMLEKEELVQAVLAARRRQNGTKAKAPAQNNKINFNSAAGRKATPTANNYGPQSHSPPAAVAPSRSAPVNSNVNKTKASTAVPPRKTQGKIKKAASRTGHQGWQSHQHKKPDPSKWKFIELRFGGSASYASIGREELVKGQSVQRGMDQMKNHPTKYVAMHYQSNVKDWPAQRQQYYLVHREGTQGYQPVGLNRNGPFTCLMLQYERCRPYPNNELPKQFRDKYTDTMTYQGKRLHSAKNKPILPGRGMGVGDSPDLKIIGDVDPSDIHQGSVGDCWLLSAISALAEFDGAVKRLFRKTPYLDSMPFHDKPNKYVISLYDLTTWKEVDIVIDERLCVQANGRLLGAAPSEDGELWVCYLEKALAAHCGGWDKIKGGQCTHGWALLTGCKHQYTIRKNNKTGKYACYAKFNPATQRWSRHANSPHDGEQSVWQVAWPKVGGGGGTKELTQEELFMKMCAWDDENYIVGASVDGVSDKHRTDGMVNNHAYSVIEAHNDVAGTDIDLFKVRNPWGKGEIENGLFDDDGPGWDRYPKVKRALNPVVADDGIFYLTKKEFFHHFSTIYLSASNMTEFLED